MRKEIEVINYGDTEIVFKRIQKSSFLKKLKTYKNGDKIPTDGVAGATYSSNAIKNGLKNDVTKFMNEVINKKK